MSPHPKPLKKGRILNVGRFLYLVGEIFYRGVYVCVFRYILGVIVCLSFGDIFTWQILYWADFVPRRFCTGEIFCAGRFSTGEIMGLWAVIVSWHSGNLLSFCNTDVHKIKHLPYSIDQNYRIFSKISRAYLKLTRFLDTLIFEPCLFKKK